MKKDIGLALIMIFVLLFFATGWITHIDNWYITDSEMNGGTIDDCPIGGTTPAALGATTITGTTITGTTFTDGTASMTGGAATGIVTNTYSDGSIVSPASTNACTLGTETATFTNENYVGSINQSVFTFASYPLVITDSEGSGGHGNVKLIDFPAGMIYVLGVVGNIAVDSVSGIADNGTFDMAMGSTDTDTDDETLEDAEADFVAKVDGTLVSGADTIDLVNNTPQTEDGHTTATDVWLDVSVTDANMTATGWMALTGTITITWVNTGDY